MDVESLSYLSETFTQFHAHFAPTFGRKQWRERSRDYLHALLVQNQERCNAENLSEVVDASPRVLQRFLTEARWEDATVTAALQAYLAPRLAHPQAVWAVDESGIVKQGKKSVGVARQYCGTVGKVANCQMGVFLAHVGPRGRAVVDKRLYLPKEWGADPQRCEAAGVPEAAQTYQSKAALALGLLTRAQTLGHLQAAWVTGEDEYGKSPEFRDGVEALEMRFRLEVPSNAPKDTPLEAQAWAAAARWPIETEFEANKSLIGLDEYEVRSWQGWNHHKRESRLIPKSSL